MELDNLEKEQRIIRDNYISGRWDMSVYLASKWMSYGINKGDIQMLDLCLNKLGIPDDMNLKERIAYYQLLGNE